MRHPVVRPFYGDPIMSVTRKLPPSGRDFEVHRVVVVGGQSTRAAAEQFRVADSRLSNRRADEGLAGRSAARGLSAYGGRPAATVQERRRRAARLPVLRGDGVLAAVARPGDAN